MLLGVDVGNSRVGWALFEGANLLEREGFSTDRGDFETLARHWEQSLYPQLKGCNLEGIIISSVVPDWDFEFKAWSKEKLELEPIFATDRNIPLNISYPNPSELGSDRLLNALAAFENVQRDTIVVDVGTATTIDYVDREGVFQGGIIAPGPGIMSDALSSRAAKLPEIKVEPIEKGVGQATNEAMQIGLFQGYVGLLNHLLTRMKSEVGGSPVVIACGGGAELFVPYLEGVDLIDTDLTLKGLRIMWDTLSKGSSSK